MNADFVPVALKAGLVNSPPNDAEGRLYREIGRSKVLPQGICVINPSCKVLAWVEFFDDDRSVIAFLDHCLKRLSRFPDARKPVPAERFMKFPSQKLADIEDNGKAPLIVERHPEGKACPAKPRVQRGTIDARLFGRAFNKDGKPMDDTRRQEHYVEDRFQVPVAMQETLAKSLEEAHSDRFRLGDDLARLLVSHAFLGELDVNPVVSVNGSKVDLEECEFWAQRVEAADDGPVRVRIEGKSAARGIQSSEEHGHWQHEVKLTWEGILEVKKDRISRLFVVARGNEKLERGNGRLESPDQAGLILSWAGRIAHLSCGVRYGILGVPIPEEETGDATAALQEIPDEARKHLVEALGGGPFLVFRDKVAEELKLSDAQKQKLLETVPDYFQKTRKTFERLKHLKPEECEKEMQLHRQSCHKKLVAFLHKTLKPEQLERLPQLELQQEGPFALGRPEIGKELNITDEQRKQLLGIVQDMQKKIEPLVKEAQLGGSSEEIRPRVMKIRKDHGDQIEAILSDRQKKQWRNRVGKPFDLGD